MSLSKQYDGGRQLLVQAGIAFTSAGIGSTAAAAAQNGATIDRQAFDRRYYSCRSILRGRLVGTTQQTVTVALSFQHSSDGTSWDNFSTATNVSKVFGSTGATGAQTVEGVAEQPVSLVGARRYIRQVATPTFSGTSSGSDAFYNAGSVILAGADEQPNT